MSADLPASLVEAARRAPQLVILPESGEPTILRAARAAYDLGVARPVLLGSAEQVRDTAFRHGISLAGLEVVELERLPEDETLPPAFLAAHPEVSAAGVRRRLRKSLSAAAVLLGAGRVDALVAGLVHTTEEVILASLASVGLQPGVRTPSSLFLMQIPGYGGVEGDLVVFADCGLVVAPDAAELADIAVTTARTTETLLGWEPRVALLSYSTHHSADGEGPERVRAAVSLVGERWPELAVDGELQLDAAIVPDVAERKVPEGSRVAGRANILVFPDLQAGNIAYKAVQRFARADAFGPFLQGFSRTVSDLSRGSSVGDVVGVITLASLHAARDTAGTES